MSTPGRAARRRAERAARKHPIPTDGSHGVMAGWCLHPAEVPTLRRAVEERLLERMGERRVGPVEWRTWPAGEHAARAIRQVMQATTGATMQTHYRVILERLRAEGGYVGVAMARRRTVDTMRLAVPESGLMVVRDPE